MMSSSDNRVHWLAGPIAYKQSDTGMHPNRRVETCKWEFIGGTPAGEIRRYHLMFSIETRKFTANSLAVGSWDKAHARDLADLYRPISILRSMLPNGSIAVAMRAMIAPANLAEVTALSIRGGK